MAGLVAALALIKATYAVGFALPLVAGLWMTGQRVTLGGAPWYYGGLPGAASLTHVLVPLCPISKAIRGHMVEALEARLEAEELVEIRRTPVYILYRRVPM